jgi:FixJ family two-component response regulator
LSQNVKISVIDDDDLVRGGIESLLRSFSYDVDAFASAAEYLACDRLHDHACIIADMQMPDMTAVDLQKRLLIGGFSIPIIFMTSNLTDRLTERLMEAGAVAVLRKPFKVESLIEHLGEALKRKSAHK